LPEQPVRPAKRAHKTIRVIVISRIECSMAYLKLVASLILFTTAFTIAGFAGAADSGGSPWIGMLAGGAVGIFFGLLFGGAIRGRLLDAIYPPDR
jgi:hypothetical protein